MMPIETAAGIRGGRMKEQWRDEFINITIFGYIVRTFVNVTMYPQPAQQ
jgi:hypothetical protein